jgi:TfoX/Sxy family transcriptional regulator of competence genes
MKVDEATQGAFEAEGSGPFVWIGKDGRQVTMSYREMPAEGMESPEGALPWARLGLEAAGRTKPRGRSPRSGG